MRKYEFTSKEEELYHQIRYLEKQLDETTYAFFNSLAKRFKNCYPNEVATDLDIFSFWEKDIKRDIEQFFVALKIEEKGGSYFKDRDKNGNMVIEKE